MSGKPITDQQIRLYMKQRKQGRTQVVAAAKAGLSECSARRIDHGELTPQPRLKRHWRTREDPLADVWQRWHKKHWMNSGCRKLTWLNSVNRKP